MHFTEYETTVVLRPDIGGELIEATLDRVRKAVADGGKMLAINHWGKKRLAYEIAKHSRGIYVHTQYLGGGGLVAEVERNLRLSENVLRFLTVRLSEDVAEADREAIEYVVPEYDAVMAEEEETDEDSFEAAGADDDAVGNDEAAAAEEVAEDATNGDGDDSDKKDEE